MDLRVKLGARIFSGFPGKEMSEDFKRAVKEYKLGNVILFSHNIESLKQLNQLCYELDQFILSETGMHPLIAIDQEGGMVSRLPERSPTLPGQMALSSLNDESVIEDLSYLNGMMLKKLGLSFNLSPVLDVNENLKNPVIGVRSFSDDYKVVSKNGVASIRGYNKSGILSCAKHFPGHGNTSKDSHLDLPIISASYDELKPHLEPFIRAIELPVPAIMTSHILFPLLESENIPCTMSKRIIQGLLRESLGFSGLVVSDCMQMNAIKQFYGCVNGGVKAFEAGVDMIFYSHDPKYVFEFVEEYERMYKDGDVDYSLFDDSLNRVLAAKSKLTNVEILDDYDFDGYRAEFDSCAKRTICHYSGSLDSIDPKRAIYISPQAFITSKVSDKIERETFSSFAAKYFLTKGIICSANPTEREIENILEHCKEYDAVVFGSYNAHLQKGQEELIKQLAKRYKLVLFVLRNPYDLKKDVCELTKASYATFEYSKRIFESCVEILERRVTPTSKLNIYLG